MSYTKIVASPYFRTSASDPSQYNANYITETASTATRRQHLIVGCKSSAAYTFDWNGAMLLTTVAKVLIHNLSTLYYADLTCQTPGGATKVRLKPGRSVLLPALTPSVDLVCLGEHASINTELEVVVFGT